MVERFRNPQAIAIFILVPLVISGFFVSRLGGRKATTSPKEAAILEISKPEVSAIPEAGGRGITLKLSGLANVDKVDIELTYDWKGRPEQYIVSEPLGESQEEFSSTIRFESCSGEDCIYHDVSQGKIKLTLSNETGGEWEEEFEFAMGEGEVVFNRK